MNKREWALIGFLILMLFLLESVATHELFTTRSPSANDFYSRWAGARALLLEGRDPYSLEVTAEIQPVIGIDPTETGRGGFAYPLYVLFLFWPLVYVPYDWAQALWMVTLQWVAIATAIALSRLEKLTPSPIGLVGLLLGTLSLYPVSRTIFLGQFTLHVTLALAAVLLALQQNRDGWAGAFLATTLIKPQMVVFTAPFLILWAVSQKRWRVLSGLLAGGALLALTSIALFPQWPISFIEDVMRYSKVAGGRNPLVVLLRLAWPSGPAAARYGLAGFLLLIMLAVWWRARRGSEESFIQAIHWTIVVSLLVPFQTGTTNQVLLLIPLFAWLRRALKQWKPLPVAMGVSGLLVGLWVLFLSTIKGNWENPLMFLPLPLLCLLMLTGIESHRLLTTRRLKPNLESGTGR